MFLRDSLREVQQAEYDVTLRFRKLKRKDADFRTQLAKERLKHTIPVLRLKLNALKQERKAKDSDTPRSSDTDKILPEPRKKEPKLSTSVYKRPTTVAAPKPLPYDEYIDNLLKKGTCRPVDAEVAVKKLEKLRKRYPGALKLLEKRKNKFSYDNSRPPLLDSNVKHRCSFSLYEAFYAPPPQEKNPSELKGCCTKYRELKDQIRDFKLDRYFRPKSQSTTGSCKPPASRQRNSS